MLAEHLQSGVENPLLGSLPSCANVGVVGEGCSANDVGEPAVCLGVDPQTGTRMICARLPPMIAATLASGRPGGR